MRTDATPLPRRKKSCLEIGYSEPGEPVIYLNFNYLVNAFIWLAGGDALTGGDANVGLHDREYRTEFSWLLTFTFTWFFRP